MNYAFQRCNTPSNPFAPERTNNFARDHGDFRFPDLSVTLEEDGDNDELYELQYPPSPLLSDKPVPLFLDLPEFRLDSLRSTDPMLYDANVQLSSKFPPNSHTLLLSPLIMPYSPSIPNLPLTDKRNPSSLTEHFSLSPSAYEGFHDPHTTPFGKRFELSRDWMMSGSHDSPVMRGSNSHGSKDRNRLLSPAILAQTRLPALFILPTNGTPTGSDKLHTAQSLILPASDSCRSSLLDPVPPRHAKVFSSSPLSSHIDVTHCRTKTDPVLTLHGTLANLRENASPTSQHAFTPRPSRLSSANIFGSSPLTPLPLALDSSVLSPDRLPQKLKVYTHLTSGNANSHLQKRRLRLEASPTPQAKKARYNLRGKSFTQLPQDGDSKFLADANDSFASSQALVPSPSASTQASQPASFGSRSFPPTIPISSDFPFFYRRFPCSSYLQTESGETGFLRTYAQHPGGTYNPPRSLLDLYTPRFVRGKGVSKVGLCPICVEHPERGGEGKKLWLGMKVSAFKCYHMQYTHGISASTGQPFSPPTAFRLTSRPNPAKFERTVVQEGLCHKCSKWAPLEGIKDVEVKVKELFWWKHAATCHSGSIIEGEGDVYEDDEIYRRSRDFSA